MLTSQTAAIASGLVRHRRFSPTPHTLKQRQTMLLLKVNDVPPQWHKGVLRCWLQRAGLQFRRTDFMRPTESALATAVQSAIKAAGFTAPTGEIIFLGHLRQWGMCMNPVCFYFCYNLDKQLHTIVAEITNTPWGERHTYILPVSQAVQQEGNRWTFAFKKAFHVSPFLPMELDYQWSFTCQDENLVIYMKLNKAGRKVFDASLNLHLQTQQNPASLAWRHPLQCQRVWLGIYWNALCLKFKGISDHPHPIRSQQRK